MNNDLLPIVMDVRERYLGKHEQFSIKIMKKDILRHLEFKYPNMSLNKIKAIQIVACSIIDPEEID